MLSLPPSVRLFVARGATDMRKSFDTLAAVVCEVVDYTAVRATRVAE